MTEASYKFHENLSKQFKDICKVHSGLQMKWSLKWMKQSQIQNDLSH